MSVEIKNGKKNSNNIGIQFNELNDNDIQKICGVTHEQITHIIENCNTEENVSNSNEHPDQKQQELTDLRENLYCFLMICRLNLSQRAAGVICGMSKTKVCVTFSNILNLLTQNFIPKYIGYSAFTRDDILESHIPNAMSIIRFSMYAYC